MDLCFVTDELRSRFGALVGRPVGRVVELPPPEAFFSPRRGGPDPALRRRFELAAPTLLAVGRLVPIKGHARLLATAEARAVGIPVVVESDPRLLARAIASAIGAGAVTGQALPPVTGV